MGREACRAWGPQSGGHEPQSRSAPAPCLRWPLAIQEASAHRLLKEFRVCPPLLPSLVHSSVIRTGSLPWPCSFSTVFLYRFLHHLSSDPPVHLPLGPSTPCPEEPTPSTPSGSPGWSPSTTISRQDAQKLLFILLESSPWFAQTVLWFTRHPCPQDFPLQPSLGASPGGSAGKSLPSSVGDGGDMGSIPGLGRSPGGGNDNPLQSSCLENSMDRGAWRAIIVHGVKKSRTHLND